ncbi:hypothetical protein [Lichenifustis flavocetrariae]|uniref:hypothetical protein n=1 Tax=Lichenifustis flavocetrariae TaxID=2949735 RepID=UPI003D0AF4D6
MMNVSHIAEAVPGHDVMLVSLGNSEDTFAFMFGARRTTPAVVCETSTRHIVAAMQATAVGRSLVVTALSHGPSRSHDR